MKPLFFIALLFISENVIAQKPGANNNTLLWQISGNGLSKPSFLYGTFHLLCKDDIHFSNACNQAISQTDEIYLELDIDDPQTILSGYKLMNMVGGKKLEDLFTPDAYKRVSAFFKDSLKTPLGLFKNMKPYFLLAMLFPKMMPCKTVSGVEEAIVSLGKKDNKEIKGLETMAFQASLFDSISYVQQADELLLSIDSMQKSKQYFEKMNNAYLKQDMNEIEKLVFDTQFGIEANQDILLDKRNLNWVKQLKEIMKKNTVFVAVGTAHLIGKNGLIELLRKEGYTVTGIKNN